MVSLVFLGLAILHLTGFVLAFKVLSRYEPSLKALCPSKSFHPLSFPAVRLWTIIISFLMTFGLFMLNLSYIVAPPVAISLQYLILIDFASAVLNINILTLMLLEKRKGNLC